MATIAIFHGSGSTPSNFWYPWLQTSLESRGHTVWLPQLPNAHEPRIDEWLPFALTRKEILSRPDTVLVGHSSGCPLILSILERIEARVRKAVLVAGFAEQLDPEHPSDILQVRYDWPKIRQNVQSLIVINSDDDPWGCDDRKGRHILANAGGTLIVRSGEGHMGSEKFNQPYREFPLLLELIESNAI